MLSGGGTLQALSHHQNATSALCEPANCNSPNDVELSENGKTWVIDQKMESAREAANPDG